MADSSGNPSPPGAAASPVGRRPLKHYVSMLGTKPTGVLSGRVEKNRTPKPSKPTKGPQDPGEQPNASSPKRPTASAAANSGSNSSLPPSRPPAGPAANAGYALQEHLESIREVIRESEYRRFVRIQAEAEERRAQEARGPDPSPSPPPSEDTEEDYDPNGYWHADQISLNMILKDRNEYSLMPSTWRLSLKGIPLPEGLFYTKTKTTAARPRIYSHIERLEYRGVLALRRLIEVHGRISDLREKQMEVKRNYTRLPHERQADENIVIDDITRHLRKTLEDAMNWAVADGSLTVYSNKQLPSNIEIFDLTWCKDDFAETVLTRMTMMAEDWSQALADLPGFEDNNRENGGENEEANEDDNTTKKPEAPVVFGFFIYKHIVTIVTLNAGDKMAAEHTSCELNFAEKNQHQWNALAVMATVCWARDLLMKKALEMKLEPVEDASELSDPDV
ncbi:hypothetical protein DL766_010361 [Monosporascus sp. MC13-8B]|uniref:Uncharacterized protein n=1 Tax=Monosporascus cannonballus TaxID=155416 RepID=A0ABY0GS20_9PEZI|nr:hypothetical protein DL762_009903 [Monosporascus cannonballus]RYO78055.1 hypothetical protein DL763_009791 [Monosporascus cannonballus]RYP02385.1 hypothetical protein DL766_010361 [Monosporascus sp. MC13-8B]